MAREILLNLNKKKSSFEISKIDRKKLYGFKKRLFIDEKGKECSKANLEEETGIVFVNSDISSCYLDYKGNYLEKKDLEAINENGKKVKKQESTIGKEVNLQSISIEDALNLKVNSVYILEPKNFDKITLVKRSLSILGFLYQQRADRLKPPRRRIFAPWRFFDQFSIIF